MKRSFKKALGLLLALAMIATMLPMGVMAASADDRGASGEWIVTFTDSAAAQAFADVNGGRLLWEGTVLVSGGDASDYAGRPDVISVTENAVMEACGYYNDERYSDQQYIPIINAESAWQLLDENYLASAVPVTVAVVDSGINGAHPDLSGRVIDGWDIVSDKAIAADENSDVSLESHGTKVAGLIAANADNNIGIAGIAGKMPVSVMPVRVLSENDKGTVANIAAGIRYAADNGADIINLSLGQSMKSAPAAMQESVDYAISKGCTVIAAAGNDGNSISTAGYNYYPAALRGVICAGSHKNAKKNSTYYSYESWSNKPVRSSDLGVSFFWLPGTDLLTTGAGSSYETFTGTSASAALLSGMTAALKSSAAANSSDMAPVMTAFDRSQNASNLLTDYANGISLMGSGGVLFTTDPGVSTEAFKDEITLGGLLYNPGAKAATMSVYASDVYSSSGDILLGEVTLNGTEREYIEASFDTSALDESFYSWKCRFTDAMGQSVEQPASNSEECGRFYVIRSENTVTVTVFGPDNKPATGATALIVDEYGVETGARADSKGRCILDLSNPEAAATLFVSGEGFYAIKSITLQSFGISKNLNVNLSDSINVTVTGSDAFEGANITAMTAGGSFELVTLDESASASFSLSCDSEISLCASGEDYILKKTVDDDIVWNLDADLASANTVTLMPSGTYQPSRLLLSLDGAVFELPAAGGSVSVAPGEYEITGYLVNPRDRYIGVSLGKQTITGAKSLSIGAGPLKAENLTLTPASPKIGQSDLTLSLKLTDSIGNPVTDYGYYYSGTKDFNSTASETYGGFSIYNEDYDSASGTWNMRGYSRGGAYEPDGEGVAEFVLTQNHASAPVGPNRIVLELNQSALGWLGNDSFTLEYTMNPQESRPSARVKVVLITENDKGSYDMGELYGGGVYAYLEDENGDPEIRNFVYEYANSDEYFIPSSASDAADESADANTSSYYADLPVGGKYDVAVFGVDNGALLMGRATADLTNTPEGATVTIEIAFNEQNPGLTLSTPEEDSLYADAAYWFAFDETPDEPLEYTLGWSGFDRVIYQNCREKEELYIGFRDYEAYGEYAEYYFFAAPESTVGTSKYVGTTELSAGIYVEKSQYAVGDTVRIAAGIKDSAENVAVYFAYLNDPDGELEEAEASLESADDAETPTVKITVYDSTNTPVASSEKYITEEVAEFTGLAAGTYTAKAEIKTLGRQTNPFKSESVFFTVTGESTASPILLPPTDFKAVPASGKAVLTWTASASEDCDHYRLARDGEIIADNIKGTTYTDAQLSGGRFYNYSIYSVDADGAVSAAATAGTNIDAASDTTPPTVPGGLTAELQTNGSVSLRWGRSTDDTAVSAYILTCNGTELARICTRMYTHLGIEPGTTCTYTVSAIDAAGNRSQESEAVSVTLTNEPSVNRLAAAYDKNRLGSMKGADISVNAHVSGSIQSAAAKLTLELNDGSTTELTCDAQGSGVLWTAAFTLPDEAAAVTKIYFEADASGEKLSAELNDRIDRAVDFSVNYDFAELTNVSGMSLTLTGNGFSAQSEISAKTGTCTFTAPAGDDYALVLTDGNGLRLYRWTDITVSYSNASVNVSAEKYLFALRIVDKQGTPIEGVRVSTDSRHGGVTNESGQVIWYETDTEIIPLRTDGDVKVTTEAFYAKTEYGTLRAEPRTLSFGATGKALRLETAVLDTVSQETRTILVNIENELGEPAPNARFVYLKSSHTMAEATTDENGKAAVSWTSVNHSPFYASIDYDASTGVDGEYYVNANTSAAFDAQSVTIQADRTFRGSLELKVNVLIEEDGNLIPIGQSSADASSLCYRIGNSTASLNTPTGKGSVLFNALQLPKGTPVTLSVSGIGEDYSLSGTGTFTLAKGSAGVPDEINVTVDKMTAAEYTVKINTLTDDYYLTPRRIIVYALSTGEKVFDEVTTLSETKVYLIPGVSYLVVGTWNTDAGEDPRYWLFSSREYVKVTPQSSDPGTLLIENDPVMNRINKSENGFSSGPEVSYLTADTFRVKTRVTIQYSRSSEVSDQSAMVILPDGAKNVSLARVPGWGNAPVSYEVKDNTVYINDNGVDLNVLHLSYDISADALENGAVSQFFRKLTFDGREFTVPLASSAAYHSVLSADIYNPKVRKTDAASQGISVFTEFDLSKYGGSGDDYILTVEEIRPDGSVVDGTQKTIALYGPVGKYTVTLFPENKIHEGKARVSVSREGESEPLETAEAYFSVVYDGSPTLKSANVCGYSLFDHSYLTISPFQNLWASVSFNNPDRVKAVYLKADTESELDTLKLVRYGDTFKGEGKLGDAIHPVSAFWIEWEEETDLSAPVAEIDLDEDPSPYAHTYSADRGVVLKPFESQEIQDQAIADWDKYVSLVANGLYDYGEAEFEAAMKDLFGPDNRWYLPAVETADGAQYQIYYEWKDQNPALNTDEAATVLLSGTPAKIRVDVDINADELTYTSRISGLGVMSLPLIDAGEEAQTMSADGLGSLFGPIINWGKEHIDELQAAKKVAEAGELLTHDYDDLPTPSAPPMPTPAPPGGSGGPCDNGGDGGDGGGDPQNKYDEYNKELDEDFDKAKQIAKDMTDDIGTGLGLLGFGGSLLGDATLSQKDNVIDSLYDAQKKHLQDINNALKDLDPDGGGGGGGGSNPDCDPPNGKQPPAGGANSTAPRSNNSLIDPSGTVYEVNTANTLSGVKASLYYYNGSVPAGFDESNAEWQSEYWQTLPAWSEEGAWTLWNSTDYGQPENPLSTDADGHYGWDVLAGAWKVVFEKAGYLPAESMVLPVPPPHLDVDINMTSTGTPAVTEVRADKNGEVIYITFDKYMTLDSLKGDGSVRIFFGDTELSGEITAADATVTAEGAKQTPTEGGAQSGVTVGREFIYAIDQTAFDPLPVGASFRVTIDGEVSCYNGMALGAKYDSGLLTVPEKNPTPPVTAIAFADYENENMTVGDSADLSAKIVLTGGDGSEAITWSTNDAEVASVDANGKVTAVSEGTATIFAECGGLSAARGVVVVRGPVTADPANNKVEFCRSDNIVVDKRCWMWSVADNYDLEGKVEGDTKFIPVSWQITEDGVVMAGAELAESETTVVTPYYPKTDGATAVGSITYQEYRYNGVSWKPVGSPVTVTNTRVVAQVTGLALKTPPAKQTVGEPLKLSDMVLNISLSDGTVSEAPYEKIEKYGITYSIEPGTVLTENDTTLTLTHTTTGITLDVSLMEEPASAAAPVISPAGGTFQNSTTVTIASATEGAKIYYTVDGSAPDENSTPYAAPFAISDTTTVKAVAFADGLKPSTVTTAVFTKQSGSGGGGGGSSGKSSFRITFDTDGGIAMDSVVVSGGKVDLSKYVPVRDGYEFDGWYSDKELTKPITAPITISSNTTVYAKWTEKTEPSGGLPFVDVSEGQWFYGDVKYVYENGLMVGTDETHFSPDLKTTRGMIVTVLYRLAGSPEVTGECPFDDVGSLSYCRDAVTWAAENGVVTGYNEKTFGPDDTITREQMATIIYRYVKLSGGGFEGAWSMRLDFDDAGDISDWAFEAVSWCCMNGIITGMDENTLNPQGSATRAQTAAILHRFIELMNEA
ncbi:MAG: S-layer homology domain-containing protein [Clostridia bacterium]|nr:S-layer homology domain-containing protein [Clostridia bacterium]